MISTIYIEEQIYDHPRTRMICKRFPRAAQVLCRRYGEVFNPGAQDFRLQKRRPSLILARKHARRVLPTPIGYGIGGSNNHYFSHMLNCLYDCRYCFLQGMYRSAHYVLFVNYEEFCADMDERLSQADGEPVWFYSGYDCDSLALEPVSSFLGHFLPWFAVRPHAHLELRTKSTQIRRLLQAEPLPNLVVAFSFTPEEMHLELEHKVPDNERRLAAMQHLQAAGWPLGLRFDPLLYHPDFRNRYRRLFRWLFSRLDATRLHSVSLGTLRLPHDYFRKIVRLYPDEPLFAGSFSCRNGMVSYPAGVESELVDFCTEELLQYVPESLLFPCSRAA